HFLAMLERGLDRVKGKAALPPETLRKALEVRRLAEEAAVGLGSTGAKESLPGYAEQVHPWIKKKIEDADKERRFGEDLLFASDNEHWKQANGHLTNAQDFYVEAQKDALEVRRALKARDQAFAELPYYSQWVARLRLLDDNQRRQTDERIKKVEELWRDVHQLAELLQPSPEHIGKGAVNLVPQTKQVNDRFREVVKFFD